MRALRGDLQQMYKQMDFLQRKGYEVKTDGEIPLIEDESYNQAVKDIYDTGVIGWWNYKEHLIENNICTNDEYLKRLRNSCSS